MDSLIILPHHTNKFLFWLSHRFPTH